MLRSRILPAILLWFIPLFLLSVLSCREENQNQPHSDREPELKIWLHSYLMPFFRTVTAPATFQQSISVQATPGEFESSVFAIKANTQYSVKISLKEGDQNAIPSDWCNIYVVESKTASSPLNRLYDLTGPVKLEPFVTKYIWISMKIPLDASPGRTRDTIRSWSS